MSRVSGASCNKIVAAARKAVVRGVLDLLSPGYCRECGREQADGNVAFCAACRGTIRWIHNACQRCGVPRVGAATSHPTRSFQTLPCAHCGPHGRHLIATSAAGVYAGPLRSAVLSYKFHGDVGVRPLLMDAARHALRQAWLAPFIERADAVVPVPQHWTKTLLRARHPVGDIARLVAMEASRDRRWNVVPLLRKSRWTSPQSTLSGDTRRRNLTGSFALRRNTPVPRHVILFDDVLTTGATAAECARVLRRGGAKSVVLIVLACAPAPGDQ